MYCPNRECPDFVEDGAPGEYVDTVGSCPKCGAELVSEFPDDEPEPRDIAEPAEELPPLDERVLPPSGLLVAVAAFDHAEETAPFVAALSDAGVTVFQFLDDGRDFEEQDFPTCTRLLVPESQAKAAAAVMRRLEASV